LLPQKGFSTINLPWVALFVQLKVDGQEGHHGIDANAIIDAGESLTVGAPVRHRKMAV
jgi:hypothetical protein